MAPHYKVKPELVEGHSPESRHMWDVAFSTTAQYAESEDPENLGFKEGLDDREKIVAKYYMMTVMKHLKDERLPDFFEALLPVAKETMEDRAEQWVRDLQNEIRRVHGLET